MADARDASDERGVGGVAPTYATLFVFTLFCSVINVCRAKVYAPLRSA